MNHESARMFVCFRFVLLRVVSWLAFSVSYFVLQLDTS